MEKVLLQFREKEFKEAQKMFKAKQEAGEKLIEVFKKTLPDHKEQQAEINIDAVLSNAMQYLHTRLEEGFNPMKLKGEKLEFLFEVSTTKLKDAQLAYQKLPFATEPTEEDFTDYAETDEELKRLKLANDLLDVVGKVRDYKKTSFINLQEFRPVVECYDGTNYRPNIDFVKCRGAYRVGVGAPVPVTGVAERKGSYQL